MADDFGMGYALGADSGGNRDGGFGGNFGEGLWAVIILAILFGRGGFGGFGGLGGGGCGDNGCATQADVRAAVDQQTLISKLDQQTYGLADSTYALNNTIVNGFNGVDRAVCTLGYNNQMGFNSLSAQLASCCCETQRSIDGVNYNMQSGFNAMNTAICGQTRDIIENQNANYRALMDYMVREKMDALRAENSDLRLRASQAAQNQYLVDQLRPCPVPAYITCNPFAASYGMGYGVNNGCGCGC